MKVYSISEKHTALLLLAKQQYVDALNELLAVERNLKTVKKELYVLEAHVLSDHKLSIAMTYSEDYCFATSDNVDESHLNLRRGYV